MLSWLYGANGRALAILDDFCLRSAAGEPAAWVFGLSVFSLHGEHIGWFENAILFDVDNLMLGFIPSPIERAVDLPACAAAPDFPALPKRPHVPALRVRPLRQPCRGWSPHVLVDYLDNALSALPAATHAPAGEPADRRVAAH